MGAVRKLIRSAKTPLPVFAVVLGVGIGILGGSAFAAEVNCSHVAEFCYGTTNNDQITGWNNTNIIEAKSGHDDVWAYPGTDTVFGGDDADNVNGGEQNDALYGEYGNDSYWVVGGSNGLFGGPGPDNLFGGVGQDFLEGNGSPDNMYGNDHSDVFFAQDGVGDVVDGNGSTPGVEQPCYVDGYDAWSNCTPH